MTCLHVDMKRVGICCVLLHICFSLRELVSGLCAITVPSTTILINRVLPAFDGHASFQIGIGIVTSVIDPRACIFLTNICL